MLVVHALLMINNIVTISREIQFANPFFCLCFIVDLLMQHNFHDIKSHKDIQEQEN